MKLLKYNRNNVNYLVNPDLSPLVTSHITSSQPNLTHIILASDALQTEPSNQPAASFAIDPTGAANLERYLAANLGKAWRDQWIIDLTLPSQPLSLEEALKTAVITFIYPKPLHKQVKLFSVGRTNGPTDKDIMSHTFEQPEGNIRFRYDVNSRIEIIKNDTKLTFTFRPLKEKNMAKLIYPNKREAVILQANTNLWLLGLHVLLNQWEEAAKIVNTIM